MNILRGGCSCSCSSGSNCWCPSVPPGGIQTSANNSDGWYDFNNDSVADLVSG